MRVSTDIRRGLIYAGLIIVVAGVAKAAAAHGLIASDWPGRATMAVMGAFLMVSGSRSQHVADSGLMRAGRRWVPRAPSDDDRYCDRLVQEFLDACANG